MPTMKYTPPIKEDPFQQQVIDLAHYLGWIVAHFKPALSQSGRWMTPVQADGKGFPDLVIVRERVIYAELKSDKKKPTDDQQKWINALRLSGEEVYVWRPRDWDEIREVLRSRKN
ncbi:MAG: VRR-NUC domain-containing protein [Armatimonadota bacterium]